MIKNIVIGTLTIALSICLYHMINPFSLGRTSRFDKPVKNKIARDDIDQYRDKWELSVYRKTKVVYYDIDTIKRYVNETFPMLTSRMKDLVPDTHKWVVGFYFMRTENEEGDPRNAFYVIPTILNKVDSTIVDYYKYKDEYRFKLTPQGQEDSDSLAYNAGHLWP